MMDSKDVTPAIHCKNEVYWIHYVLRDLFKVFPHVMMIDTGSTDDTVNIATLTARAAEGSLDLHVEDMGDDALRIGNCPNMLREAVETPWMLLVDGDEIWQERQLCGMLEQFNPRHDDEVGIVNARNLAWVPDNNKLMERDGFAADRLFARHVRWDVRCDYPFQSHGLENRNVYYNDFYVAWFWHTRHVQRSPNDEDTFFRDEKRGYYPYDGPYTELPFDWLGDVCKQWPNPYLDIE